MPPQAALSLTSMLELPIKRGSTSGNDSSLALIKYITKHYDEPGTDYADEIAQLLQMRAASTTPVASQEACRAVDQYCAQLDMLLPRFAAGPLEFAGTWTDTLTTPSPGKDVPAATLRGERASVLYNAASIRANLGLQQWTSARGIDERCLRAACGYFQSAAGIFEALDGAAAGAGDNAASDLLPQALALYRPLMLAQAQECFTAKALLDKRKSSLVARLCAQVAEYYDQAHAAALLLGELPRTLPAAGWAKFIRCKAVNYRALCQLYAAQSARETEKWGEEVSRLQETVVLFDDLLRIARARRGSGSGAAPIDTAVCEQARAHAEAKLTKASTENNTIWHEKVAPVGSLPAVKPASVVSPTTWARDATATDVFKRLVPLKTHMEASKYSEQKAELVRRNNAIAERKSLELQRALLAMGLEETVYQGSATADGAAEQIASTGSSAAYEVPAEVFTKAAVLRDTTGQGVPGFEDKLVRLQQRCADMGRTLATCAACVPTDSPLASELSALQTSLAEAESLDSETREAFTALQPSLALLCGPAESIKASLPKSSSGSSNTGSGSTGDSTAAATRVTELVEKTKLLLRLRREALRELRTSVAADDITAALVAATDPAAVMMEEIKKHATAELKLRANIESQDKLLPALVEAHAATASTRQSKEEITAKCDAYIQGLLSDAEDFYDLQRRVENGVRFYDAFGKSLDALKLKIGQAASAGGGAGVALPPPVSVPKTPKLAGGVTGSRVGKALRRNSSASSISPRSPTSTRKRAAGLARRISIALNPFEAQRLAAYSESSLRGGDIASENPGGDADGAGFIEEGLGENQTSSAATAGGASSVINAISTTAVLEEESETEALARALDRFAESIKRLEVTHRSGSQGFSKEFDLLKYDDLKFYDASMCSVALANKDKNRYKDILPYDTTRVRLQPAPGPEGNDYVNACHIEPLAPGSPRYICSQGPTPATIGDFWKLVKQQRARIIVMVTNLVEMGRRKCEQYWPATDGETHSFPASPAGSAVDVTRTGEVEKSGWIERYFSVVEWLPSGAMSSLKVTQYHYTSWPDRGVPKSPAHFLAFRAAVDAGHAKSSGSEDPGPMLVHCSAGVGRTGTFCCIHSNLKMLPHMAAAAGLDGKGPRLDILETVRKMRKQRRHMVQSLAQYEFCYRCTLSGAQIYLHGRVREEEEAAAAAVLAETKRAVLNRPPVTAQDMANNPFGIAATTTTTATTNDSISTVVPDAAAPAGLSTGMASAAAELEDTVSAAVAAAPVIAAPHSTMALAPTPTKEVTPPAAVASAKPVPTPLVIPAGVSTTASFKPTANPFGSPPPCSGVGSREMEGGRGVVGGVVGGAGGGGSGSGGSDGTDNPFAASANSAALATTPFAPSQQSPFGTAPASALIQPFGQVTATGSAAQASPFGAAPVPASLFGAAPVPASPFGAAPVPASPFGAVSVPASPFGAAPLPSSTLTSPFGAPSPALANASTTIAPTSTTTATTLPVINPFAGSSTAVAPGAGAVAAGAAPATNPFAASAGTEVAPKNVMDLFDTGLGAVPPATLQPQRDGSAPSLLD